MTDLLTRDAIIARLERCQSVQEWNAACTEIATAGDKKLLEWFARYVQSGMAGILMRRLGLL